MTGTRADVPAGPIGILGGTFDPVHHGHLRLAIELRDRLDLAQVRLIPTGRPPHRDQPAASPGQRAKWIRVAVADEPRLVLDDREIMRSGPSYTVDTLSQLRDSFPDNPLCLIMGTDVFAKLPSWHRWQELFEYAHIVFVRRPGMDGELDSQLREQIERRECSREELRQHTHGGIHVCEPPPLEISGSRIRDLIAAGASPRYLLPDEVLSDIMEAGIYGPAQTATA